MTRRPSRRKLTAAVIKPILNRRIAILGGDARVRWACGQRAAHLHCREQPSALREAVAALRHPYLRLSSAEWIRHRRPLCRRGEEVKLMWEPADVEQAIADFPNEAEDALAAIQLDPDAKRLDSAAFKVAAEVTGRLAERIWVESLDDRGLLESFVRALVARGVPLDVGPIDVGVTNIARDALAKFVNAASSFGCRIRKDGNIVGSGVLVGPTTVLTAWHVVARAGPMDAQEPYPKIEVVLADNRVVDARVPALVSSPCGEKEYQGEFPSCDADVAQAHDVAVLRLAKPAGAQLG